MDLSSKTKMKLTILVLFINYITTHAVTSDNEQEAIEDLIKSNIFLSNLFSIEDDVSGKDVDKTHALKLNTDMAKVADNLDKEIREDLDMIVFPDTDIKELYEKLRSGKTVTEANNAKDVIGRDEITGAWNVPVFESKSGSDINIDDFKNDSFSKLPNKNVFSFNKHKKEEAAPTTTKVPKTDSGVNKNNRTEVKPSTEINLTKSETHNLNPGRPDSKNVMQVAYSQSNVNQPSSNKQTNPHQNLDTPQILSPQTTTYLLIPNGNMNTNQNIQGQSKQQFLPQNQNYILTQPNTIQNNLNAQNFQQPNQYTDNGLNGHQLAGVQVPNIVPQNGFNNNNYQIAPNQNYVAQIPVIQNTGVMVPISIDGNGNVYYDNNHYQQAQSNAVNHQTLGDINAEDNDNNIYLLNIHKNGNKGQNYLVVPIGADKKKF